MPYTTIESFFNLLGVVTTDSWETGGGGGFRVKGAAEGGLNRGMAWRGSAPTKGGIHSPLVASHRVRFVPPTVTLSQFLPSPVTQPANKIFLPLLPHTITRSRRFY